MAGYASCGVWKKPRRLFHQRHRSASSARSPMALRERQRPPRLLETAVRKQGIHGRCGATQAAHSNPGSPVAGFGALGHEAVAVAFGEMRHAHMLPAKMPHNTWFHPILDRATLSLWLQGVGVKDG